MLCIRNDQWFQIRTESWPSHVRCKILNQNYQLEIFIAHKHFSFTLCSNVINYISIFAEWMFVIMDRANFALGLCNHYDKKVKVKHSRYKWKSNSIICHGIDSTFPAVHIGKSGECINENEHRFISNLK